jgi:hypothetical protein
MAEGFGECIFTRHWTDGSLTVDRADPRVLIDAEVLDDIRDGRCGPELSLRGDVLTIDATNRRVIYRIGEHLMLPDRYVAEWPD